jgi:hypothetical protein
VLRRRTAAGVLVQARDGNRAGSVQRIRDQLAALPGVAVLDVVGWDALWPVLDPEHIKADLRVGVSGRLVICDLTLEAMAGRRPFILARVGDWAPVIWCEAGVRRHVAGCPESIDVYPGCPFTQLTGLALGSPAEVVTNYPLVSAAVEAWPETEATALLGDGRVIRYAKVRQKTGA